MKKDKSNDKYEKESIPEGLESTKESDSELEKDAVKASEQALDEVDEIYQNYFNNEQERLANKKNIDVNLLSPEGVTHKSLVIRCLAEFLGSFIVVLFVGLTVIASVCVSSSLNMASLAVGAGLGVAIAYLLFSNISGGHANPIITVAMACMKRMSIKDALLYILWQIVGAAAACGIIYCVVPVIENYKIYASTWMKFISNGINDQFPSYLASQDLYGNSYPLAPNMLAAILIEIIIATVFVGIFIKMLEYKNTSLVARACVLGISFGGLTAIGYNFSSSGINPARSIATALFAEDWSAMTGPLSQVWIYLVCPIVGAVLAVSLYCIFRHLPKGKNNEDFYDELIGGNFDDEISSDESEDSESGEDEEVSEDNESDESESDAGESKEEDSADEKVKTA